MPWQICSPENLSCYFKNSRLRYSKLTNTEGFLSISHDEVKKAILKSQHCQRNWDLSQEVPKQDIDLFVSAVSQCPSKQNISYYKAHFITNRNIIEKIHNKTDGFIISFEDGTSTTNPQVLANLLVVFESKNVELSDQKDIYRNQQTWDLKNSPDKSDEVSQCFQRDQNMAVGIAAGYLNLSASLLGYATGCCACFDGEGIQQLLGFSKQPLLMMGIGHRDLTKSRLAHHTDSEFLFPTKSKQKIEVQHIG